MPAPTWLINAVLPAGGLVGLVGPPGAGKTFIALDIALSVSTGSPWQGHDVDRGYVLYISAEGGVGIGKRVAAWLQDRDIKPREAKIAWLTEAVPIHAHSEGMDTLIERVTSEIEAQPVLVVIDTMARCFDGDENQQEDMGRFVAGVDRLRTEFDAAVVVVHHTRLDGERERGNTAFRGAADTMMFVTRQSKTSAIELICNKQKDAEEFDEITLKLKMIPEKDSCAIALGRGSSKAQKAAEVLSLLNDNGPLTWDEWFQLAEDVGVPKTTFNRYLMGLKESKQITKENGHYRVLEPSRPKLSKGLVP